MANDKTEPKADNTLPPETDALVINREVIADKAFMFRVNGTGGFHEEQEPVRDRQGKLVLVPVLGGDNRPEVRQVQVKDKDGKNPRAVSVPVMRIQTRAVLYGPKREAGDVFRSNQPLDEIHRPPVGYPPKYTRLDRAGDPNAEELSRRNSQNRALTAEFQRVLQAMDLRALHNYAEAEGIEVPPSLTDKDKVIERILKAKAELVAA